MSIAPGETVALLGPNGAGKSTTIDMILDLSDSRTVSVFGQPPDHAVRAGAIGAMLQTGAVVGNPLSFVLADLDWIDLHL